MAASYSNTCSKPLDVLIIGGGLSGVYLAHALSSSVVSSSSKLGDSNANNNVVQWKLLEATDRLGGRLRNDASNQFIDMGGAWVWPHHQPNMHQLLNEHQIPTFVQPDDDSSTRIVGGAVHIVDKLVANMSTDVIEEGNTANTNSNIMLKSPVKKCTLISAPEEATTPPVDTGNNNSVIEVETKNGEKYWSKHVVFAIPPNLISESITFDPPVSSTKATAMKESRTWMASVTKVALQYNQPFWKKHKRHISNMGLSGTPAFQVYDSCCSNSDDDDVAALTFFTHVSSKNDDDDATLGKHVADQISTIWSRMGLLEYSTLAHKYHTVHVVRWPHQLYIAGPTNKSNSNVYTQSMYPHPHVVPALSQSEWNNKLHFAGSETDQSSPGVMEGAVGAAKRVYTNIMKYL